MDEHVALGRLGEKLLDFWATQARFTSNKVQEDEEGWDFLLQFPPERASQSESLDLRPGEMSCLIQVKATRTDTSSWSLKLSNLERLVKWPLPAFIFVARFDEHDNPVSAHIVHVGRELIGQVLKRLREVNASDAVALHKIRLPVTWADSDRLPEIHGSALRAALRKAIGDDVAAYSTEKLRVLSEIGYDDHHYHVKLTIEGQDSNELYQSLSDFALGLADELPAHECEASVARFGIEQPVEGMEPMSNASIRLSEVPFVASARVEVSHSSGELAEFGVRVRMARSVFPFLPPRYQKVLFASEFVSLLFEPLADDTNVARVSWSFRLPPPGARLALGKVVSVARVLRLLSSPGKARVRVQFEDRAAELPISRGSIDAPAGLPRYARLIERAWTVMSVFGVPLDTMIDPAELEHQHQQLAIMEVLARPGNDLAARVLAAGMEKPPADSGEIAILIAPTVVLGDKALIVVAALVGPPEWQPEHGGLWAEVSSRSPQILRKLIIPRGEVYAIDKTGIYDEIEKRLRSQGVSTIIAPE